MARVLTGEWQSLQRLLPKGWEQAARDLGAFQRARQVPSVGALLRLVLFHAVSDASLRNTAQAAQDAGLANMSDVALRKRLTSSVPWLRWLCLQLCHEFRLSLPPCDGLRLRALDGSTVQGPRSKGTEWRLHYTLDLLSLDCDWNHLSDAHTSEALELTPVRAGDVLLADRNYLRPAGVRHAVQHGADVLVRLKWTHPRLLSARGKPLFALEKASRLQVGQAGQWQAFLFDPQTPDAAIEGRVVAVRLPAPLAELQRRRVNKAARRKGRIADPRSLKAAGLVLLFTTLPKKRFSAEQVLGMYRWRWQVELAFKRLKQLLRLGQLPHAEPNAAQGWILSKLLVALLLEKLYRQARTLSPWGLDSVERGTSGQSMALVEASTSLPTPTPLPGAYASGAARGQPKRRRVA